MQGLAEKIGAWGRGVPEESGAWLVLQTLPGMSPERLNRLMEAYEGPAEALRASGPEFTRLAGRRAAEALRRESPDDISRRIRREAEKEGVRIIARSDPGFPAPLKDIYAPPGAMFVKGDIWEKDALGVAVVGMRSPSAYGRRAARNLAGALAERGITIVSGLAKGIDAEAHRAALEAGGRTIAVLGCGFRVDYPAGHADLRREIAESGAILTELGWDAPPRAENFPRRNRLISGLSMATVVVEAAQRSGALITARLALEQGREVMAVPGPIDSTRSGGCHRLIKEGAHLVESVEDILDALPGYIRDSLSPGEAPRPAPSPALADDEAAVMNCLAEGANTAEDLVKGANLRPEKVSAALLNLELEGLVRQSEGGLYERS